MKKLFLFGFVLLAFLLTPSSCNPEDISVTITMKNNSSNDIHMFVQVTLADDNENFDASNKLQPGKSRVWSDKFVVGYPDLGQGGEMTEYEISVYSGANGVIYDEEEFTVSDLTGSLDVIVTWNGSESSMEIK